MATAVPAQDDLDALASLAADGEDEATAAAVDAPDTNVDSDDDPANEAVQQRVHGIVDAARHAEQLAQALIERVDALHERAAAVQHASLQTLLEQLKATQSRLSDSLDHQLQHTQDVGQQAQAAGEQARSEAASAVDQLGAQMDRLGKTVGDEVQVTSTSLSNQVHAQVEQYAQQVQGRLGELLSRTQISWSRAQDEVQRAVDDVLHKTDQSLSGAQSGSLKATEESLQRISQLKSDVDHCARALGELIGTFSDLMGSTRTGLNVTAGTLNDLVTIFKEIA